MPGVRLKQAPQNTLPFFRLGSTPMLGREGRVQGMDYVTGCQILFLWLLYFSRISLENYINLFVFIHVIKLGKQYTNKNTGSPGSRYDHLVAKYSKDLYKTL